MLRKTYSYIKQKIMEMKLENAKNIQSAGGRPIGFDSRLLFEFVQKLPDPVKRLGQLSHGRGIGTA
ncbi:hypothetical protein J2TS6_26420 [Paenibacillus albilobatus]|uniref:Uncharacterized protein n=1 Tax=Paenibacillus albilobatus TaxID=2716884 RepID=A0A919XG20_9BACL|nr:hypothetical protein J2TS6_26420 [Paenibacillus albilobatus]